jgi:hypothetical protein
VTTQHVRPGIERLPSLDIMALTRRGVFAAEGIVAVDTHASERLRLPAWVQFVADADAMVVCVRTPSGVRTDTIEVAWQPCRLGGHRAWWQCPLCDGRHGTLFWHRGTWGCRKCHQVSYRSQRTRKRRYSALDDIKLAARARISQARDLDEAAEMAAAAAYLERHAKQ